MTNTKIIKGISFFMLIIMLISTFALPAFATTDPEPEAEPVSFWEKVLNAITEVLAVIAGIILFIVYTLFIIIAFILNMLFVLGQAIVDFVILIVNSIKGLF